MEIDKDSEWFIMEQEIDRQVLLFNAETYNNGFIMKHNRVREQFLSQYQAACRYSL